MTDQLLDRLYTAFEAEVRGVPATGPQLLHDAHAQLLHLHRRVERAEHLADRARRRLDHLCAAWDAREAEFTDATAALELARDNDAARYRAALAAALNRFDRAEAYRLAVERLPERVHHARTPASGAARDSRLLAEVIKTVTTANRRYATAHTQNHPEGISA